MLESRTDTLKSSIDNLNAFRVERSCAIVASILSEKVCKEVRLVSGDRRCFGGSAGRKTIYFPYPPLGEHWTFRTWTCGIAMQCSPSKDHLSQYSLSVLSALEIKALAIVEAEVALGWVAIRWPGLLPELKRELPFLEVNTDDLDGPEMLVAAKKLASSKKTFFEHPLLGELILGAHNRGSILATIRRAQARMSWTIRKRYLSPNYDSIGVGGDGDIRSINLPPPSRPENDDIDIRADQRSGIPYPEWNIWSEDYLHDYVAVLERKHEYKSATTRPISGDLRRWFEEHTHRVMKNRLEDGTDLDVNLYIDHHIGLLTGKASDGRVFRDLLPGFRDVTTAILLDGSASLGANQGQIFQLELECADALCRAMTLAKERHGLFVFSGNTRHRVDVTCLKDFNDRHSVVPSGFDLRTGGYTRLGAPIRHLTRRLQEQPSERRLLIIIGDGLMSDEGYEGLYAWADVSNSVEKAEEATVSIFYIGIGQVRVDPLPNVFGPRRSVRISRVEELPRVLSQVHRELMYA